MHDGQAGLPLSGLLERELERGGAIVQVAEAHTHMMMRRRGDVADHDDRAGRVAGDVPADRTEHQRGERARAAGPDDEHERAGPAVGHRLSRLAGQLVGVDQQAGGNRGGVGGRDGEGLVAVPDQHVGHGGQVRTALACDHPWQ